MNYGREYYLKQKLVEIEQKYKAEAKPIIDELVEIESLNPVNITSDKVNALLNQLQATEDGE